MTVVTTEHPESIAGEVSPILVTLDIDWAPEWVIESVVERLVRAGVRATLFATHDSSFLRSLEGDPRVEIGLHPNFLPGSSHGSTPEEIFATLRNWYPRATVCRTHSLVQSEPLLARMACEFGIEVDCSIHLPRAAHVAPHELHISERGHSIIRLPHVFQDNMHAMTGRTWDAAGAKLDTPGWKVLNFHPVHVALNTARLATYEALKRRGPLGSLTRADLPPADPRAPGTGTFFDAVLARLRGEPSFTVSERVALWRKGRRRDS